MCHLQIGDFKLVLYICLSRTLMNHDVPRIRHRRHIQSVPYDSNYNRNCKRYRNCTKYKNCKINLNVNNSSFSTTNINTLHITWHNNMSLHDDPTTLIIFHFYIKYNSLNIILAWLRLSWPLVKWLCFRR